MNKVVLIGRLTKDPELRFSPGTGIAISRFTIAVNRRKKEDGTQEADFIPCVAWRKQAENLANYQKKGNQIAVTGRIQTSSYDGKDGIKRYVTEVIAEEIQFLDKVNREINQSSGADYDSGWSDPVDDDDEIPF